MRKIITIFFETVTILLFNNKINITNKTILSFNFTLFILNTKKEKKIHLHGHGLIIESLSIVQKPQELQVVTTKDYVVLLNCGCLSLNAFIEFRIRNNSSSSDVLYIQASISISPKYESK